MTATTDTWPKHPDGSNKTVGEMTPEESRPILRAAFLRSKLGAVASHLADAFADPSEPDDTLNDIAADNEAARDDEFNTWGEEDAA